MGIRIDKINDNKDAFEVLKNNIEMLNKIKELNNGKQPTTIINGRGRTSNNASNATGNDSGAGKQIETNKDARGITELSALKQEKSRRRASKVRSDQRIV